MRKDDETVEHGHEITAVEHGGMPTGGGSYSVTSPGLNCFVLMVGNVFFDAETSDSMTHTSGKLTALEVVQSWCGVLFASDGGPIW